MTVLKVESWLELVAWGCFNRAPAPVSRTRGRDSLKGRLEQNHSEGVVKSKRVHNLWREGAGFV